MIRSLNKKRKKIKKINQEHLLCQFCRVRTGFKVIDPQVEAAQARLEAMRTGRSSKKPAPPTTKPLHKEAKTKGIIFQDPYIISTVTFHGSF